MTTYCEYKQNNNKHILILFILAISMLVFLVLPFTMEIVNNGNNHSIEKHGLDTVETIQYCLNKNGEIQLWQKGDRFARLCMIEENKYGIEIVDKVGNKLQHVTAFIKEKMTRLPQVENYLTNTGYVRVK